MQNILVRDVMQRKVKYVPLTASVKRAAEIMKKYNIGSVIVMGKNNKPAGIVTKTDIVFKYVAGKKRKLREVMSKKLITISPNKTIDEAAELMAKHHIEKLPVVERGKLVGIISASDILRVEPGYHTILKEELKMKGVPLLKEESAVGFCESCGNYSEDLREVNGMWLCEECR